MSLSKVTSANGNSLARLPAQHAAAQLFGTSLANSPAGYKDYDWADVQLLGIAVVADGNNSGSPKPQLGKSDMHAAALDKILLHWANNTQIRGLANTPREHAYAVMLFYADADDQAKALAIALRAAATKLDEDYDRAALGTFEFSMFPAIDRLLLSPKTPSQRDAALGEVR